MTQLKTSVAAWLCLIGIMSFWIFWFSVGRLATTQLAYSLMLGCAITLMVQWFLPAFRAVKSPQSSGAGLTAFAIFGIVCALAVQRIFAIVNFKLDYPDWLLESFMPSLSAWTLFFFLAVLVLAPGTTAGVVPVRNFWQLTVAIFIGGIVSGIGIGAFILK